MEHRRLVVLVLIVVVVLAASARAQEDRDPIPLKDWPVSFEQVRGKVAETRPGVIAERALHPSANAVPSAPSTFITLVPCRIVDTRNANGPYGGPKLVGGTSRSFVIPNGPCAGIPVGAAYSLNLTVTQPETNNGFLKAYPSGSVQPLVASLNFNANETKGNAAIVPADSSGSIDIFSNVNTHLIIDINGYFAEGGGTSANVPNTLVQRDSTGSFAAGTITATKVLGAVYQDLAEWVPSGSNFPSGTVVVLDPADGRRVIASSHAYDTSVAGVVSENPGILLGTAGANKAQIATTGRVNVLVDADAGPIRIGDLLVTSDALGMAMRSEPIYIDGHAVHRPGTIIGKALEPLASGKRAILVLLSLQ